MPDPSETPAPEVPAPEAPAAGEATPEAGRLVSGPVYCDYRGCPNNEPGLDPHVRQQNCPTMKVLGPNPFDSLFVSPAEAERLKAEREAQPVVEVPPKPEEKDEPEEGEILAEAVKKIGRALEKLGRRGLNMRGVIALLHDANPAISKKAIKAVLEGLRELPAIYGQDPKRP